jgi:hypothetical protein
MSTNIKDLGMRIISQVRNNPNKHHIELNNKILVGSHHKAGTFWMYHIFNKICQSYGWKFYNGKQEDLPKDFAVFFQDHSNKFDLDQLGLDYRGLHIIRDPRDLIISGCFYHQKSKEVWLHTKRDEFDGLTYQEKLNSYDSLDDKIIFEMENCGRESIFEMIKWDYLNPLFFEVKYEDLIIDESLLLFHKIFNFLEFPGKAIPHVLKISYDNSLFSGNPKNSTHIRSGKSRQWEKYFNARIKDRFLELYGDCLIRLGYETPYVS